MLCRTGTSLTFRSSRRAPGCALRARLTSYVRSQNAEPTSRPMTIAVAPQDFRVQQAIRFTQQMDEAVSRPTEEPFTLDFSRSTGAFASAMLPVCIKAMALREKGVQLRLIEPRDFNLRKLFSNTGWNHLIEPDRFERVQLGPSLRQFPATNYRTHEEQNQVLNRIMELILSVTPNLDRRAFAAVEWALNEITDNVLNHSESTVGGLLQLSVFHAAARRVEFTVADAGRSIYIMLGSTLSNVGSQTFSWPRSEKVSPETQLTSKAMGCLERFKYLAQIEEYLRLTLVGLT